MRRIKVRGIALHEGKLLAVRLKPYTEVAASGGEWWCLPGGTVDDGESLESSLAREMLEETGIPATVGQLLYVHQFMLENKEYLEFFFHIQNSADFLSVDLSKTSHGMEEIEKIEFVDAGSTFVLPAFLCSEDIEVQIRPETTVKFFSFQ